MSRFFQYGPRYDTSQTIQGDWNRRYGGGFGANEAGLRNMYGGLRFILSGGKIPFEYDPEGRVEYSKTDPLYGPIVPYRPSNKPSRPRDPPPPKKPEKPKQAKKKSIMVKAQPYKEIVYDLNKKRYRVNKNHF
jgi:hypothetical protein